jgi:hypothetical protein
MPSVKMNFSSMPPPRLRRWLSFGPTPGKSSPEVAFGRGDTVPAGRRGRRQLVALGVADQVEEDLGIAVAAAGLVAGERASRCTS